VSTESLFAVTYATKSVNQSNCQIHDASCRDAATRRKHKHMLLHMHGPPFNMNTTLPALLYIFRPWAAPKPIHSHVNW
jgi:hypothetical protein